MLGFSDHFWLRVSITLKILQLSLGTAHGGGCYLLLGSITAALRPQWRPRLLKRGPRSASSTAQTDRSSEVQNGRNPEALTMGAMEDSWARSWCPNAASRSSKKTKRMLPRGFWKFLVHGIKGLEVPPMCRKSHHAETAHHVASENPKARVERAAPLAIRATSPNASKEGE